MSRHLDAIWRRAIKRGLIAGGLEAAHLISRLGLLRQLRGEGAIFTLHHVRPFERHAIDPNAHLEVTPDFLDLALTRLARDGYDFIPLTDLPRRLASPEPRRFACFTLDDGYRDNADHALAVFERHGAPFTIFVTPGFADRTHSIWWETLAELLNAQSRLSFDFGRGMEAIEIATPAQKLNAFDRFCRFIWDGDEAEAVAALDRLARQHGIEPLDITARLTMDGAQLRALSQHPLATLGAHTVSHRALKRLSDAAASEEILRSSQWLTALTGAAPRTIAYPYGTHDAVDARDKALVQEAGFDLAVTTRPGTIAPALAESHSGLAALPRISLNGYYQSARCVAALASGIPFAIMRG
ncbi:polysaccharide deacetylase family protein [Rhizobium sp. SSA_523]|uniref:polysaccharide deacetylase family protein n=1 Tax=Rhizobium sp. SSA_523 TaxID=2952477 RepID=UPI00208FFEF1|nr:polysaccharide deacetylase family protein [Rhizobium sp. SSA_523]MCO5731060.1 polysaccharide deacetylase family protein [Rhizobium sp. SSA_523]WKC24138.1 polysaccharide deacetylase family protein [Rhizobium sp. SSA_523]